MVGGPETEQVSVSPVLVNLISLCKLVTTVQRIYIKNNASYSIFARCPREPLFVLLYSNLTHHQKHRSLPPHPATTFVHGHIYIALVLLLRLPLTDDRSPGPSLFILLYYYHRWWLLGLLSALNLANLNFKQTWIRSRIVDDDSSASRREEQFLLIWGDR